MRKSFLFTLGLLFFSSLSCIAQSIHVPMPVDEFRYDIKSSSKSEWRHNANQRMIADKWTVLIEVSDGEYLAVHSDGETFYMGGLKKIGYENERFIRNGKGLCVRAEEAYYGEWKKDSRHGLGIEKNEGEIICGRWKWNSLDSKSERPANDDEKMKLDSAMLQMQKLMILLH